MENLYLEINPTKNEVSGPPIELDVNWNNIGGIIFLSDDELYDLSWAGHENVGFIKLCNENKDRIMQLDYYPPILNALKVKYKEILHNYYLVKENSPIIINEKFSLQLTEKNKLDLIMKYHECLNDLNLIFKWKTVSGFVELTSEEFINLYLKIQKYIQSLRDLEYSIYNQIDECKNIVDFLNLNVEFNFDNKIIL